MTRKKIWIDSDGGVDDALAISYALENQSIDIRGISAVVGNVPLNKAYANIKHLLTIFRREDIPVVPGRVMPLIGEINHCAEVHGESGLGWMNPLPFQRYRGKSLGEMLTETDAESLVCLGPLTNIASNLDSVEGNPQISSIHSMCGTFEAPNYLTGEYNLFVDPEAASKVLTSKKELFFYGTEVCDPLILRSLLLNNLQTGVKGKALDLLLQWYDLKPLYDPVAVIGALNRDLFEFSHVPISVSEERGKFKIDSRRKKIAYAHASKDVIKEFSDVLLKSRENKDITVLSPHIDDAFFSIGGTIIKYKDVCKINVLNIFSDSAYSRITSPDISALRRLEDIACFEGLDVNLQFLGFNDWTRREYSAWNEAPSDSDSYINFIRSAILNRINPSNSTLLKPLAIGGCVDHVILSSFRGLTENEFSYEDLPYASYPELHAGSEYTRPFRIKISKFVEEKLARAALYKSQISPEELERIREYTLHKNSFHYETLWKK